MFQGRAQLQALWGPSLYHLGDLPFAQDLADMPNVFTPFREKVEKKGQVRRDCVEGPHDTGIWLVGLAQLVLDRPLNTTPQLVWPTSSCVGLCPIIV